MSYKVHSMVWLSLAAGAGSTIGFVVFYFVGAGSRNISQKLKEKVDAIDVDKFNKSGMVVMAISSLASIPPCTPLSIAAGTLRYSMMKFVVVLFLFRTLKYGIIGCFYDQLHTALLKGMHALEGFSSPVVEYFKALF